ncbi:MAG: hypothetical protein R3D85_09470 [Paracoccaceae bacterium]
MVGAYPPLVNYLPNRVSFLSDTAPPPRNPKLQYCVEQYTGEQLAAGNDPSAAISAAQGLDLSVLPKKMAGDVKKAFDNAETALPSLTAIFAAEDEVNKAAAEYRPLQREVRSIEKDIRKLETKADDLQTTIGRMHGEAEDKARLEARRDGFMSAAEALKAQIPDSWTEAHKAFATLTGAEQKARQTYRRQADQAWTAPAEVLAVLNANDAFDGLEGELRELRGFIESVTEDDPVAEETVSALEEKFNAVEGAGDVKSALGKARRALRVKKFDRDKALEAFDDAMSAFEEQKAWRTAAAGLKPGLQAYLDGIKGTLGIRSQNRLDRDQALYMASCSSVHRDISLNF